MKLYFQKVDWKLNLSWFSYGYWKCIFVDFLNQIHASFPTMFTIERRVVIDILNTWSGLF